MDAEMRVLALITTPMALNGQTLFPMRFAAHMPRVRTDYLTWRVDDPKIMAMAQAQGARVFVAPNRLRRPLSYAAFVARTVRREGYDIVHCHGNSRTLALDLLGARLGGARVRIAHSHNSSGSYPALHRLLTPPFFALYTHAMACSEAAGRWLFGNRPFEVVPNAIDVSAFAFDPERRAQTRQALGLADGACAVGCVAALEPPKNHALLLDAFAKAADARPDLVLLLAGEGSLRDEIASRIRALGLQGRVRMLGRRDDIPALLSAMDALVLPSLHEGLPTVALEAQSAGLAPLLSDAITRECDPAGNALFLPPDANAWAGALKDAAPMPDRAGRSAANAAELAAAGFDLDPAARALQARYESILSIGSGQRR